MNTLAERIGHIKYCMPAGRIIRAGLAAVLGLSCGAHTLFSMPLLSSALAGGLWLYGLDLYPALIGCIAGALTAKNWAAACSCGLIGACAIVASLLKKRLHKGLKLLLVLACQLVFVPVFFIPGLSRLAAGLGSAALASLIAPTVGRGLRLISERETRCAVSVADQLAICGIAAMTVMSLAPLSLYGFNIGCIAAISLSLVCVRAKGAAGVCISAAFGACLLPDGIELAFAGALAIASAAACTGRHTHKAVGAVLFTGAFCAAVYFLKMLDARLYILCGVGALLFLLLPEKLYSFMAGEGAMVSRAEARLMRMKRRVKAAGATLAAVGAAGSAELSGIARVLENIAEDAPPVKSAYAIAHHGAARAKGRGKSSGDSFLVSDTDEGTLLIISDGMGSGESAGHESRRMAKLMAGLVACGFPLADAVVRLNAAMINGEEMFATLDVLHFDRRDGSARIVKQGSPPSFVVRNDRVHSIYAESLPLGIVSEAVPSVHSIRLLPGDRVIMLTDGVSDALGDGLIACLTDISAKSADAKQTAEAIISAASAISDCDDMCALVGFVSSV